jgi:excisionase family DNA binding protein
VGGLSPAIRVVEPEEDAFYTVPSLAQRLSVVRKTVRRMLEDGEIPYYEVRGAIRIDPQDVDSYLARRRIDRRAA